MRLQALETRSGQRGDQARKKGDWNRGMTNHTLTLLSFMAMKIAAKAQKVDAKVQ